MTGTKHGLNGLTKTVALETATFGITSNAVAPGFIETDMTAATAARVKMDFDDFKNAAASQIPVRRVGQAGDVAHTISFLTSEGAGFVSGQVISRTGRYKLFPIVGTAVMVVGLFLLSTMSASTSRLSSSLYMFVLGLGLGSVMQVLVLAVQNAVDYEDLGVATSGATLFRAIGARSEPRF